jgi:hypothetical protein
VTATTVQLADGAMRSTMVPSPQTFRTELELIAKQRLFPELAPLWIPLNLMAAYYYFHPRRPAFSVKFTVAPVGTVRVEERNRPFHPFATREQGHHGATWGAWRLPMYSHWQFCFHSRREHLMVESRACTPRPLLLVCNVAG